MRVGIVMMAGEGGYLVRMGIVMMAGEGGYCDDGW